MLKNKCYHKVNNHKFIFLFSIFKKYFGMGSFHSKIVILGAGFAGITLSKLLVNVKLFFILETF